MAKQWTNTEILKVKALVSEGRSWKEIARILGKTPDSCRGAWRRHKDNTRQEECSCNESFLVPLDVERSSVSWRERLELAGRLKQVRDSDTCTLKLTKRTIKTTRPYAVLFSSDWQLGSLGTDLELWKSHIETFLSIENMGMIVVGDLISNCYTHRTLVPVLSQVMSPVEQMRFVRELLEEIISKNKLISVTLSEEHDQRDARDTGMSALIEILRPLQVPLFDNRGCLILEVGKQQYVLDIVHKSRYSSFLNELHSGNREARLHLPANVIVTAHRHRPALGKYFWFQELADVLKFCNAPVTLGGEVFLVQTGTYEKESTYGNQFFGTLPSAELQILVFWPDEHRIEMATNFQSALKLLE